MQMVIIDGTELEAIKTIQQEILNQLKKPIDNDGLISLELAEKLTGMEKQTLRKMFLSGQLPGKRFGRAIRLDRATLLDCREK